MNKLIFWMVLKIVALVASKYDLKVTFEVKYKDKPEENKKESEEKICEDLFHKDSDYTG